MEGKVETFNNTKWTHQVIAKISRLYGFIMQVGQSLVLKTKLALGMEVKVASEDVDMDGVQTTSQSKKRQSRSGDDLGGDFSDFNLADAGPKKKAKR